MTNLTLERVRAQLTLASLSKAADVSEKTIRNIETGDSSGSDLTLIRLARALKWPETRFRELAKEVREEDENGPHSAA